MLCYEAKIKGAACASNRLSCFYPSPNTARFLVPLNSISYRSRVCLRPSRLSRKSLEHPCSRAAAPSSNSPSGEGQSPRKPNASSIPTGACWQLRRRPRTQRRKTSVPSKFLPRRSPRQHSKNCSSITKRQRPERDCASPNATCSVLSTISLRDTHRHVARRSKDARHLQSSVACRAWTKRLAA